MSLVTLADLVTPVTQADALQLELTTATLLGLQTTTWQPIDPSRTIFQVNASIIAQFSVTINLAAQGGYASYAALMTDPSGNPITTWMDLISFNNYNVLRFQATNAAGPVPYTNASATSYPYSPNSPLKFQNPAAPNATYTSVGTGTLTGSSSGTVNVVADAAFSGGAGSAGVGTTLILMTPKSGVTINPQTIALVGTTQETNAALLTRCQAKLGSLSSLTALQAVAPTVPNPVPIAPGGASGSYYFVATSIPQGVQSAVWPYYVTTQVTRATVVSNPFTGVVQVYVATAAGALSVGDLAVVNAAIQALCVPQAVTAIVAAATPVNVSVTCSVWIRVTAGVTAAQATANIRAALTALFPTVPIGGYNISGGILPIQLIEDTIFNANNGTVDVQVSLPTGDVPLLANQVAILNGTPSVTVNLV